VLIEAKGSGRLVELTQGRVSLHRLAVANAEHRRKRASLVHKPIGRQGKDRNVATDRQCRRPNGSPDDDTVAEFAGRFEERISNDNPLCS
jgi:hypothetical protein